MANHARFGGSSAYRWTACPGSIKACEGLPKRPGGEAAERGTMLHGIMEIIPELYFKWQAEILLDDWLEEFVGVSLGEGPKFQKSDIPTIKHAVETTAAIYSAFVGEYDGAKSYRELRCEILPDMWGTADLIVTAGTSGLVLDYKFGKHPVPLVNNWQGIFYALGASKRFPHIDQWYFAIVQPDVQAIPTSLEDADALYWQIPKGLLKRAELKFYQSRDDALSEEPPRNAGEQCQYCAAKALCSAFKETYIERSKLLDPGNLTELQSCLDQVALVEEWCKDTRSYAKEALKKGASFYGWKMVNGGRGYEYLDLEGAASVLSGIEFPISEELFPTPAKIRKFFPEVFDSMVAAGIIQELTKDYKMVQDKEPGRAVNPNVLALTNLIKLN